ncbi:hypothetical protein OHA72_10330 [Dactylosporangium sp. NBC_01737]|uniref:hypothetical protein n=1 Tax=Dactylosporangium sp. NBC_01737 TaxID=2975959 RepID=UPI002E138255|nr:hypothetical protein OHA72_10330 [Dactylosporangium sp. NBC_01737]
MICGEPGFATGDGHLCPEHGGRPPAPATRLRPSLSWHVLTWLFVAVTIGYFGLLVAHIAALAAVDTIVTDPASFSTAASRAVFDGAALLSNVTLVWIWVYLAGFIAWSVSSRRHVQRLGHDRTEILGHWTYTTWRLSLVPVVVLSLVLANRPLPGTDDPAAFRDAFVSRSYALMGYTILRIAMVALLSAYAIIVWRRVTQTSSPPNTTGQPDTHRNIRQRGPLGAIIGAGLAGLMLVAVIVIVAAKSATAPHVAGTAPRPSAAATPGPSPVRPTATLAAPDAIVEYEKPVDQTPATTMRTAHPFPGVEHPFDAYYHDPAGHTATIWGGTGEAFNRDFDTDALDALLSSLGPVGGATADHFRLAMDGLARAARCSQFTSQSQRGTACVWAGHGAVLAFVFTGLDAPGASDIMWRMLDGIIVL